VAFRKEHAKAMLFHDLPDPAADRLADMLPKQPYACFSTPTHYDPFGDPNYQGTLAYIYTEADNIVPYEAQKQYVQMGQIKHTYVLKNSSHSPHIEIPDRLAGVVLDLVKQITET
jgi:pimeloyl-ACP methyl ester carboxylesterase